MITVQGTPLITHDELGNALRGFREFVKITKQGHTFANNIESGLQKIFLMLNNAVQSRDIPGYIRILDGMWRKLFFKGKLYLCGGCSTKYTYTESCPVSHDEQQKNNNDQQQVKTQQERPNTQQNPETSNYRHNRTESMQTVQHVPATENQQQPLQILEDAREQKATRGWIMTVQQAHPHVH